MAEDSFPRPDRASGSLLPSEYEDLLAAYTMSGLVGLPSDQFVVYADGSGRSIKVRANRRGYVRGRLWRSGPVEYTVPITANAGANRVDLAVLRLTRTGTDPHRLNLVVREGTSGSSSAPAPVQDTADLAAGVWEFPVAEVTAPTGSGAINASHVKPRAWFLAPAGGIVCTSSTRPPNVAGLMITETDTDRTLVGNGTAWRITAEDYAPTVVTFKNAQNQATGWDAPAFNHLQRRNGWVFLDLVPRRTGTAIGPGWWDLGTLPAAYRPSRDQEFGGAWAGGTNATISVRASNGAIQIRVFAQVSTGNYANLPPLFWPAA